ncbi:MBL fold metallo-hydrolase [Haloparvum sp. PAK95]|uniref:MBL fold metallo-hydrolase n=1 Tax=Haloparvum sp. PAK95 TaxID=3418962 RepID=UPI003D2EB6FA
MSVSYDDLRFERLGHASVRVETSDGTVVYVDPWSDVVEGDPSDGDVVFVTHADFDHYDPDGIEAVAGPDATVAVFEGVDTSDLDRDVVALAERGETVVDGIDVVTEPAYNEPTGGHVDEDGEPFHAQGDGIGIVLGLAGNSVFVVGDSDHLPHHDALSPDVLIPPIGGHYTMDRHEAAELVEETDPDLVLPVHYDTFEPIETDARAFADVVEGLGARVELF